MHAEELGRLKHDHAFGVDVYSISERRTKWVVAITAAMMIVEIAGGWYFGSMALLADGWHMGTHAVAMGIAVFAYVYARRHASDPRYSFGTGKVGALGGFASAVGLAVISLVVLGESVARLATPVDIRFDEAIGVAVVGLVVNVVCALLLRGVSAPDDGPHEHARGHGHAHGHGHGSSSTDVDSTQHRDHNLRGAYLHVIADALTSVLAIAALLAGRQLGWAWMDPAMGIVGSIVIARWSVRLVRDTSAVLLDAEVERARRDRIREAFAAHADTEVADLHLWRVGPAHLAAIVSVVSHSPEDPDHYKRLLARFKDLAHVTVEVHRCRGEDCRGQAEQQTDG
jgi:cation diffusion facilitator family transporter